MVYVLMNVFYNSLVQFVDIFMCANQFCHLRNICH